MDKEKIERAGLIESKRFSFAATNLDELEKLLRTASTNLGRNTTIPAKY